MNDSIINNIIRVGRVSSVDGNTARVAFLDRKDSDGNPHISAPLKILKRPLARQGGSPTADEGVWGDAPFQNDDDWTPEINQLVLCVFLANGESDGIVLGGI